MIGIKQPRFYYVETGKVVLLRCSDMRLGGSYQPFNMHKSILDSDRPVFAMRRAVTARRNFIPPAD